MNQPDFPELAQDVLDTFTEAVDLAKQKLAAAEGASGDGLAGGNTFTGEGAFRQLRSIAQRTRDGWDALSREPAISRLIVEDQAGEQSVLYISRKTGAVLPSGKKLANYDTAMGRLAELDVGDEESIRLPSGDQIYRVIEKTILHPRLVEAGWDSWSNVYAHVDSERFSIQSLRDLLRTFGAEAGDDLDRLLGREALKKSVRAGLSHQVRTAMGLRDQPILDKFQGEIFRLPIESQLIILGPPGTGKTTTLIKRLGQKLDVDALDPRERQVVSGAAQMDVHENSWLMFTPSELLKHYLREAFNREEIPTPEARIQTWETYRVNIARNTLGILRSANGGRYTLRPDADYMTEGLLEDARDWFDAFREFHNNRLRKQLKDGSGMAAEAAPAATAAIARSLVELADSLDARDWMAIYRDLDAREADFRAVLEESRAVTDRLLKGARNSLYNADKEVFARLALFLENLQQDDEPDDDEEFDNDEADGFGEQTGQTAGDIQNAVKAYLSALRALSRSRYRNRAMPKDSRAARVVAWLDGKLPPEAVLIEIGQRTSFQNGLRRFINASRRYVSDVPRSYLAFRKENVGRTEFYKNAPTSPRHLSPVELDAVVLLMLRNCRSLLAQSFVARNVDSQRFEVIKRVSSLFRTQIMVDEATDLSTLQLACMEGLASLPGRSFFACGDFNQRITDSGIRSTDQLAWVSPRITAKRIKFIYRQSRSLNEFAGELLEIMGGDMSTRGELPEDSTHEGVKPALLEHAGTDTAAWIAQRIMEVERTVRQMPTIAVLVNSKEDVAPMAGNLTKYLQPVNLKAVACDERVLGEGTDVRVFEVRHIKGLEFEAVFFADVDGLAKLKPDLFHRYLYVGATRAATYLGMVCEKALPARLTGLRRMFCERWDA